MRYRLVLMALLALHAVPALAQTIVVEGVLSPAWLEHDGSLAPLAVGMQLGDRDRIRTGPGARALLRLAEGSAVKLGENAMLELDGVADRRDAGVERLFTASLDVVRGAFRFTTGIFGKHAAGREVKVRISTVTVGIRGTDLWGKSDEARDLVCLIEGRISVSHAETGEFTMAEPLSFLVAPRREKPLPVAPVDRKQLELWAAETEIQGGSGGARRGGRYQVDASVSPDQKTALAAYDTLRAAGYPAVLHPVKTESGYEYRVRIQQLPTQQDAQAAVEKMKTLGLAEAAVSK
jgi:hypothetical protein